MKYKKGSGDQPSLSNFFGSTISKKQQTKPTVSDAACPGLSYHHDPHITRYLSQTSMNVGGAPNRSELKCRILMSLHQHHKLSGKQLWSRVQAAERAEAAWSNDHASGTVYSTKCTSRGIIGDGLTLVIPCDECNKVLHMWIFCNALCHLPPKKANWKYTPKEYRNELLGKAYMCHIDVQEFMEDVSGHFFCVSRLHELNINFLLNGNLADYNRFTLDYVRKARNSWSLPRPVCIPGYARCYHEG
jgi:hypothetical protein